jgi:hypothetical protein
MQTVINEVLKPEFWTPGPNSWDSTCQGWSLLPLHQIKRHGKEQRKEVYYSAWDTCGKRRSRHSAPFQPSERQT